MSSHQLQLGFGTSFTITKVKVFNYLKSKKCSNKTHHQCLAKKLRDSKKCLDFGKGEPCSPFSLPNDNNTSLHFPLCNKNEAKKRKCYLVEYQKRSEDNSCREAKSCRIKEYMVEKRSVFKGQICSLVKFRTIGCFV